MKEKVYLALQFLEDLASQANEAGDKDKLCSLQLCLQALSDLAYVHFSDVTEVKQKNPIAIDSSIGKILSYTDPSFLREKYPSLENKAMTTAIDTISKIEFDTNEFERKAQQVIQDVNDEVILQLLSF